jgi:hypothetical protein
MDLLQPASGSQPGPGDCEKRCRTNSPLARVSGNCGIRFIVSRHPPTSMGDRPPAGKNRIHRAICGRSSEPPMENTRTGVTVASYSVPKTLKAAIGGARMKSLSEEPSSSISDCRTSLFHARLQDCGRPFSFLTADHGSTKQQWMVHKVRLDALVEIFDQYCQGVLRAAPDFCGKASCERRPGTSTKRDPRLRPPGMASPRRSPAGFRANDPSDA